MSFNIAVAGKGGSGKTAITSLIIRYLKKEGTGPILAVDADSNANLGDSLGLSVRLRDRALARPDPGALYGRLLGCRLGVRRGAGLGGGLPRFHVGGRGSNGLP